MKVIGERLRGVIERYDYDSLSWAALVYLSSDGDSFEGVTCPGNVVSASTKRQCCADGAFEIGGAYAGTLSMVARLPGVTRNMLRAARIRLQSKYDTEDEWANVGTFFVVDARRQGEFFTISGQDGLGWADTSSYNDSGNDIGHGVAFMLSHSGTMYQLGLLLGNDYMETGGKYTPGITYIVNLLAATQTGIAVRAGADTAALLPWKPWDFTKNGNYCNRDVYEPNSEGKWEKNGSLTYFRVYYDDYDSGTSETDCPRDYYRWAAQIFGGFITVDRDGFATMRQFWMPELGMAEISSADMEMDSAEVADYTLYPMQVTVVPEGTYPLTYKDDEGETVTIMVEMGYYRIYTKQEDFNYAKYSPMRITVESNPLLNGFCRQFSLRTAQTLAWGLWYEFHPTTEDGYADNERVIRPFKATVHKAARFELGQKIQIKWHELHETTDQTYYSVITSVEWKFRGGHVLSCAGEDSRVMADCVRMTKADKAVKELRNRMKTMRSSS